MNGAIVVSDTSPIRALAHLGLVEVLASLFGRVLVPPAVVAELRQATALLPSLDVSQWPFFEVRAVGDLARASPYIRRLHAGEAHAIALAMEVGATHLLIDERVGRKMARAAGVVPVGALGVLVQAKRAGHIHAVKPLVDRLVSDIQFRVSASIREQTLADAGETD